MPPTASEFERDVLPHLDAAYNLARWLVRDPAVAEDVVQEALLRALRYQDGRRGAVRPWLLRIVRNAAYAAIGARRRLAEVPLEGEAVAAPPAPPFGDALGDAPGDPEAAFARRQALERLDGALAALPEELRECLVLRELEELSYREIAQVTGVAIGTVMSRLWRARRALLAAAR
ncbi:sigma-70 family RNA polymerase sigma factor [Roseomonas sp. NAR14]|uniref:Sigma-70 family RNA polymerase sigma factor n=1 Tax=Roseomonas acroporae TaxID=2937791 RepID=A0A9X2BTF5_9PROT|nr:sigma-70 family RNA polymerase sigma factor [Roseomonas acroporae]MCK8784558.1 sigma-70 family RNA polymerase sigma factor [Roseomonas acroporae]